ncbi:MAG: DUF2752 domain-containing protein [Deltaproteobacteria bacterium]|nr:DUF2752 domain-containing protein [Deltaproteobacteria bacterium]
MSQVVGREFTTDPLGRYVPVCLVSGLVLALARWFPLQWLPLRSCAFLEMTGYPCPFCGYTRAFWAMARGEWGTALHNCPLGALLFVGVAVLFVWSLFGVAGRGVEAQRLRKRRFSSSWMVVFLSCLVLGNWIYRLAMGFK